MLVLGLVSAVQADYARFEVDSGSTVAAGQTITINLISDLPCNGWEISGVAEVDASGNQTVLTYGGTASNIQFNPAYSLIEAGFVDNYEGSLFGSYSVSFLGPLPAGESIMSFDYTINGSWDGSAITIAPLEAGKIYTYALGESYPVDASSADLGIPGNVLIQGLTIPEPMTVALLSLGSLFLRRKKK